MSLFLPSKTDQIKSLIEAGGKYSILSAFHEGAMGYAYRARHNYLGIDVFLKVIDADPEVENTFAEPKALMDVSSGSGTDNLVRLYDAGHLTHDYVLMVMEFVDGGSLNTLMRTHKIAQMDAVNLAMGVLVGVSTLHAERFCTATLNQAIYLLRWPTAAEL